MLELKLIDEGQLDCTELDGTVKSVSCSNDFTLSGITYFFRITDEDNGTVRIQLLWYLFSDDIKCLGEWIVENDLKTIKMFFNSINFDLNIEP